MRQTFVIAFLVSSFLCQGQLIIKPIKRDDDNIKARVNATKAIQNPINLPFWDDFSITNDAPDSIRIWGTDTSYQWNYDASKDVFVNATLAINPPSYRVATFDGLDVNGSFHTDTEEWADQLVSDTIDLQGKADVILSFYWQAGGNVELPEEGDSLRLQFYNPNAEVNSRWKTAWKVDGADITNGQDTVFTQEAVEIDAEFLTQKFVFRFQSFGDKDGPFDAWHLDWIYLDEGRTRNEAFQGYEDGTFTSDLSSPISPFKSIPTDQFNIDNRYIQNQKVSVSYLNEIPGEIYPVDMTYRVRAVNDNILIIDDQRGSEPLFAGSDTTLLIGFTEEITARDPLILSEQDFSVIPSYDSVVLESEIYFFDDTPIFLNNSDIDLRINDTIRTQYLLQDFYAFDDGTAEFAAGTNIAGGQVAVQFWLDQPDTLTHVDIYFPKIDPLSGDSPLELRIFKDLEDEPIRSQNIRVVNKEGINVFHRYELTRPLILADTFFLGYEQSANEYIGVGFDRSNPEASQYIFENKTGVWEQNSRLTGALMIRPVFGTDNRPDTVTAIRDEELLTVYPNPTQNSIRIDGNYKAISLMDFSGRMLLKEEASTLHDFTRLKSGLYLLTIHRKEGDQTIKIIKE